MRDLTADADGVVSGESRVEEPAAPAVAAPRDRGHRDRRGQGKCVLDLVVSSRTFIKTVPFTLIDFLSLGSLLG